MPSSPLSPKSRGGFRSRAAGSLVAVALAGLGAVAAAPGASAATITVIPVGCSSTGVATIAAAGRVSFKASCVGGRFTVAGVVTDTADDGRCLQLSVVFPGAATKRFSPVCGVNRSAPYTATGAGTLATLRVSVA